MNQPLPMTDSEQLKSSNSEPGKLKRMLKKSAVMRILLVGRLIWPLGVLVGTLLFTIVFSAVVYLSSEEHKLAGVFLIVAVIALLAVIVGALRLRQQLLKPLAELEQAVNDVCHGEPWSSLPLDSVGVLGGVARDLDSLSGELIDLYEDMDNRVARQTRRLAQQTAALKILYDVAASINKVSDLDELLIRFMPVLKEMVHAYSAKIQVLTPEGNMRLVASIDGKEQVLLEHEQLPVHLCACGKALSSADVICSHDAEECSQRNNRKMYSSEQMEEVTVPLNFHDDVLGMYTLYVKRPGLSGREDLRELLSTIGNHLGMAIAKQRSDEEAYRLSIMRERTALAHELHDSLAQTLASLRLQVRMLDETMEQTNSDKRAHHELDRIRNGIEEAHTELRALLYSFRAPIDQRGLEPALERMTDRFRQNTGIPIFFQRSCRQITLGASEEMQILRIVQESLANIRKHAHAHTVRILMTCNSEGEYMLLIEDDGVGFENQSQEGSPGEHIGLSIMEERARRLGGTLRIESEPGEGTRVELIYNPGAKQAERQQKEAV
ncbi:MAG: histidine kinase [Chromatiales bacterium]|nr:histidine kinase [Chromatiales bacterium]